MRGALGRDALGGLPLLLEAPLLRDVGDVERPAARAGDKAQVIPAALGHAHVEAGGLVHVDGAAEPALHARYPPRRGQGPRDPAEQFVLRGAQHALRFAIGEDDPPLVVERQKSVAHVAQGAAERVTGGPGLVVLPADADQPDGFTVFVVRRPAAHPDPAVGAVQATDAVLRLVHRVIPDRALRRAESRCQVVRMNVLHPVLDLPDEVRGSGAEHFQGRLVPGETPGADVPLP